MTDAYSPQRHAREVGNLTDLVRQFRRDLALMRGDLARLVLMVQSMQRARESNETDPALDALVRAAFDALGTSTWTMADLMGRSIKDDPAGNALLTAMTATGKGGPRSLGRYLADSVPGPAGRLTIDGYELRRCGVDRNCLAWTVAIV